MEQISSEFLLLFGGQTGNLSHQFGHVHGKKMTVPGRIAIHGFARGVMSSGGHVAQDCILLYRRFETG